MMLKKHIEKFLEMKNWKKEIDCDEKIPPMKKIKPQKDDHDQQRVVVIKN